MVQDDGWQRLRTTTLMVMMVVLWWALAAVVMVVTFRHLCLVGVFAASFGRLRTTCYRSGMDAEDPPTQPCECANHHDPYPN
jgi:hypothetical protein